MEFFKVWALLMLGTLMGVCISSMIAVHDISELKADIVGAPVEQFKCYDTGCSFLVEHADQSREWLWLPKLVTKRSKK